MNKFKMSSVCCFILALLLLAGCHASPASEMTTIQPLAPTDLYLQAANNINETDSLAYQIDTTYETDWNGQSFSRNSKQLLNIQDPGKDTMRIFMEQSLTYSDFSVDLCEYYENGKGYITISDSAFSTPFSATEFMQRYAPAVLFDPSIYKQIEAEPLESNTKIFFEDPTAAEQWALPEGASLNSASGYALIDKFGALQKSVYTLSYAYGDASITQTTKIYIKNNCNIQPPENISAFVPIDHFDAPILLEQACGYLLQGDFVQSKATTSTNCQTFSISRTQKTDLLLSGSNKDLYAKLDISINQINQSRGGEVTEMQQSEWFENGIYCVRINGADPTENPSIDATAMRDYCQDLLVQDILLPAHITGVSVQEDDSTITLTFQASDILAEAICSNICNSLYSDPALLHALSSDYSTQSVECKLTLNKHTGILLAYSSKYSAYHEIENISYQLDSQTEQTYEYIKSTN